LRTILLAGVCVALLATPVIAAKPKAAAPAASHASAASPDARFKAIYSKEWAWRQAEFGDSEDTPSDGRRSRSHLPHEDAATHAKRLAYWTDVLKQLDGLKPASLSAPEQVNYAIYRTQIETLVADEHFHTWEMPLNSDSSFWANLAGTARRPLHTAAAYRAYIAQLNDMPRYFHEEIVDMRSGLKRGFSVPRVSLTGRDQSIADVAGQTAPESNVFWGPFAHMPASIPAAEQAQLKAEAAKAIANSVVPAHKELLAFMREEYLPQTRTTLAAEAMPDGKAFYRSQIREYTTLDLDPEAIHQMGLSEVARIHAEMVETMKASGFKGSFPEFLQFLRTDPQFYAKTPEELLAKAAWIAKQGDGKIPEYFGHAPRGRFSIVPVPLSIAPYYTSGRGGAHTYWLNTYDLAHRPLYNLTALTLHEAEFGHAFQLSLAEEQKDQPAFRRESYISAYGEGWGLYVEKLGKEMGLYETPYDEFGRETYEMWRACRLVVDTGIHHKGWSREQAIDYLAENTALPHHEIETEVDRYITWPAQALSYKLGEMDIVRNRARAEKALGPKFDIRAFHDTVLSLGSVPLPVLDARIDQFIAEGGKGPYPLTPR
jgi:uncharacterized protein (DUF885 family)